MGLFLIKRFLAMIPVLFVLSFLTLALIHLTPGNYFDQMRMNPQMSPEVIRQYEQSFHVQENVFVQYFYWLKGILRFDFGFSFTYQQPVATVIGMRLWNTFLLSFAAFLFSWCVAIPLGILAAMRRGGFIDRLLNAIAYGLISFPGFLLAILLVYFAAHYTSLPIGGMRSVRYEEFSALERIGDIARHMVIPVVAVSAFSTAYLFRLMRSHTIEVLNMDFIRVLRTRGLGRRVFLKHVIRNAINPLITLFGMELPGLFSGAALIEILTGWPGLGQMMLQAVRSQDIFLVMGNMVMIAFLLILGNLIADVLLGLTDPRLKME